MMLDRVLNAVDENESMHVEFREDVKQLITKFASIFPQVSLENLENRIKNVRIERTNKLVSRKPYEYNAMENILRFSEIALKNEYNAKHLLMSGLLCMITAHDNTYGLSTKENKFVTFNIGYTEILSSFLAGNAGETDFYEEEVIATNIIAEIVGAETLFTAYFTNNPKLLSAKFVESGIDLYAGSY